MTMKPMSTLSFNGEDAFEIKDSEAREALETLNTELDKSKREISEQIVVLERLQPETAMVGHILEVDSVDETGKPLTYRAVENKPDIEVDDTLTQEGKAADAKATGEALKNISVDETLTFAEYQALSEEEKDSNKTFYIKDANIMDINNVVKTDAKQIEFDNTGTTLTSKEVQGALVEVDNKLANKANCIATTASGETIVATDSDERKPLGLAIDGKSEQTQYSGKNLLEITGKTQTINGVTFTVNNDGTVTVNGTASAEAGFVLNAKMSLKGGTTYILNGCPSGGSKDTYYLNVGYIGEDTGNGKNKTVTQDVNEVYAHIFVKAGVTVNNLVFKPMVRLAIETDSTYEPYCGGIPSPNPSYPQEIRNIGVYDEASGKYAVEVKGNKKNLIDFDNVGNVETPSGTQRSGFIFDKKGTFTLSIFEGSPVQFVYYYIFRNGAWGSQIVLEWGRTSKATFTLNENEKILVHVASAYSIQQAKGYLQLECGTVATDYEPFEKATVKVLLPQPLRKGDKAYWNGGSKVRVDRYSKGLVLTKDNVEISRIANDTVICAFIDNDVSDSLGWLDYSKYSHTIRSNRFKGINYANGDKGEAGITIANKKLRLYFGYDSSITSIEDVKALFEEWGELYIEYDLSEPITEEIDIDLGELTMFYPTTILSNDCNANMEVTYAVDTKTYIAKLENKIVEQNQNLGGFTPIIDDTGKITGYKTEVGADTVFPFSSDNGYTNEYHGIDGKAGLNYTTSNECIVTLVVSSAKKLNTSTWKYEYYYDVNPETKTPTLLTVTGGEVERLGYTEHTLAGCVRTEGDLEITMTNYVACVGQMIFRCTPSEDTMTLQVPRVIGEYGMGYFIEKVPS